jgi:hypothetical protein
MKDRWLTAAKLCLQWDRQSNASGAGHYLND